MAKDESLTDILSDEPKEPEAPVVEAPASEAPAEEVSKEAEEKRESYMSKRQQARNKEAIAQGKVLDPDTGQFVFPRAEAPVKAEEPKAAEPVKAEPAKPAAQEFTDKEKAFLRAAQEERNKRQELERRLAAIEKPAEPAKTFWDDPEAALAKQRQQIEQTIVGTRLQTSEAIARTRYQDFDDKVAKFTELAQTVPGLTQQMLNAQDPAEFVYKTAKNHIELQEAGGLDALRSKMEGEIEAKVRARLEGELKAKADALEKARSDLPESLSQARAVGGATKPVWSGPPSMASILKD